MVPFGPSKPKSPVSLRPVVSYNIWRHSIKGSPTTKGLLFAPLPLPLVLSSSTLTLSLLPTLLQELLTCVAILSRSKGTFGISHRTSPQCVYLTSALVLTTWLWQASFRRSKIYIVLSADCRFLEHGVSTQPFLISSQGSEPCFLPGEWDVRLEQHCDDYGTSPSSELKRRK